MKTKLILITFALSISCADSINAQDNIQKKYYKSGKLNSETPYTDDKKNGIVKYYGKDGKLISETPYTNDKRNGIQKYYDPSGNVKNEISYTDDIPHTR